MANPIVVQYVNLCNLDKVKKVPNGWLFRCYVCGDSSKNKRKRRGNIIEGDGDKIIYYCHNCGTNISFLNFLKEHKPHLYKEYRMAMFKQKLMSKGEWVEHNKQIIDDQITEEEESIPQITPSNQLLEQLDEVDEHADALQYLRARQLPEEFINELYYSQHYLKFLSDNNLKIIDNVEKINSDVRVVIPVYDINKNMTHLQGRSLDPKNNIRYLTCDLIKGSKKIWGLDRVDIKKPIYIFEGVFDAVFIDNAIAGLGSFIDYDYLKSIAKNKLIYCPDADFRTNIFLEKNLVNMVKKGIDLYFTPKDVKQKDINDMILAGWKKEQIQAMLNNHTFSGAMAIARIKFMKIRQF
jgi:hypothetical protein